MHKSNDEAPASRARGRPCSENCSLWSVHQASDLLSVVLIRAGRAARCWKPQKSRHCCRIHTIVRWIDRFEWDHPRQRVGEGRGRARAAHTHGHAQARALLRLVPANISATPEGSDGNSKCRDPHRSVRARGHTHNATRARGAKGWPRKVKRFALFRRQRGSDTGEYRLRPCGAVGGAVEVGAAAAGAPATSIAESSSDLAFRAV